MERNTVTGKNFGERRRGKGEGRTLSFSRRKALSRGSSEGGFTLLELMIVMAILVILAAVALPRYQAVVVHAKEATLRDDLFQMRKAIDQFAADKGKLPQDLEELAGSHYLREIPKDPITDAKDWNQVTGEDPASVEGGSGLTDVHSSSTDTSTDGTPYSEW
jgi:general secretion pathway protein G